MSDHLCTDFNQLLPNRCERPVAHFIWQRQRAHEVPKVVGKSEELKAHRIISEHLARELRPSDGVLTFFDPLLGSAPFVVEVNYTGGVPPEICHDEPHAGEELTPVPLDLGDDASGLRPTLRPVAEARVEDLGLEGRSPYGTGEHVVDRLLQFLVGGQANGVRVVFSLQELIDLWTCETCVPSEESR